MGNQESSTAPAATPAQKKQAQSMSSQKRTDDWEKVIVGLRQLKRALDQEYSGVGGTSAEKPAYTSSSLEVARRYVNSEEPLREHVNYTVLSSGSKVEPFTFATGIANMVTLATYLAATPPSTLVKLEEDDGTHAVIAQVDLAGVCVTLDCDHIEDRLTFANIVRANTRKQAIHPSHALALATSVYLLQQCVEKSANTECFTPALKRLFAQPPRMVLIACLSETGYTEEYELHGDTAFWLSTPFGGRERGLGSYVISLDKCAPAASSCTSSGAPTSATKPNDRRARDFSAMVNV
jgi:hypothetical protein